MTVLGIIWFALIAVLMAGYFILDGFDLGVGVLYPFLGKSEKSKKIMRSAIGPVWDGNEVWLLTAGGALFAAFPAAYATSFSGFYLAIMLVLFGLILRAVSLEFRANDPHTPKIWDVTFFIGSLLPALLFGVAIGNIMAGVALNENGDYIGTFFQLLTPFALVAGVLGLVHMLTQGAAWIALKAPYEGFDDLRANAQKLRNVLLIVDLVLFVLTTVLFFVLVVPNSSVGLGLTPVAVVFAVVFLAGWLVALLQGKKFEHKHDLLGFLGIEVSALALVGIIAATMFPNFIVASNDPALSIVIANAASPDSTLFPMTIITIIGVPLVLIYHVLIYRKFRGRLTGGEKHGY